MAALAAACAAAPSTPPAAPPPRQAASLLPGGVTHPSGRTGYLATPRGVAAVDLVTGDLLWETAAAGRPLLADGERVYAYSAAGGARVRVLALDPDDGRTLFASGPVDFPPWVAAGGSPRCAFAGEARLERGALVWSWEAASLERATVPRPPPVGPPAPPELPARRHARGVARIDLRGGAVEVTPADAPAAPTPPVDLTRLVVRWQGVAGGAFKALLMEESPDGQRLVLHAWDPETGREAPPRELLAGARLLVRPTLDGHHLALRDAGPGTGVRAEDGPRPAWLLVATATGDAVGRLPYEPGTQAVSVLGRRAFCQVAGGARVSPGRAAVQPRALRAVDLPTGKTLWECPLAGQAVEAVGP